jgi:hypothetical protein
VLPLQLPWFCSAEPAKFVASRFSRGFGVIGSCGLPRILNLHAPNRGLTAQLAVRNPVPASAGPLPPPPDDGASIPS